MKICSWIHLKTKNRRDATFLESKWGGGLVPIHYIRELTEGSSPSGNHALRKANLPIPPLVLPQPKWSCFSCPCFCRLYTELGVLRFRWPVNQFICPPIDLPNLDSASCVTCPIALARLTLTKTLEVRTEAFERHWWSLTLRHTFFGVPGWRSSLSDGFLVSA